MLKQTCFVLKLGERDVCLRRLRTFLKKGSKNSQNFKKHI